MTLSILAHDPSTGAIGGAAATGNLAVGAWVLRVSLQAGAVATQGYSVSPLWGDQALFDLGKHQAPESIVEALTTEDVGRDYRQLSVLNTQGQTAVWTGVRNKPTCGEVMGDGFVVAGNWLTDEKVVHTVAETYDRLRQQQANAQMSEWLISALEAGLDAGGDSRGTQSAAVKVLTPTTAPLDLRVDYDPEPMRKLRELHKRATSPPYSDWMCHVPVHDDPFRY